MIVDLMMKHENRVSDEGRIFVTRRSAFVIFLLLFFGIFLRCGQCASPSPIPATADNRLPAPQTEAERNYLGISTTAERFSLDDVRTEILVVDFFDMYCHVCQTRAPEMNEFYKLVQGRGLSGRVKIFGVGVGDTIKEATIFKEKFAVPFPVLPDRSGSFSKQFGKIKVPNLIVFKKHSGHFDVVYQDSTLPKNPEEFLSKVLSYATTQISSFASKSDPKCINDGTMRRCPLVLSPQGAISDKRKLAPLSGQEHPETTK